MKTLDLITAHLLLPVYLGCSTVVAVQPLAPSPEEVFTKSINQNPGEAIERFERRDPATAAEFFTLALAYFARANFRSALDLANRALALSPDDGAKALCFQLVAQCHGALQQYDLAAEAALHGLRLTPDSRELSALSLVYAEKAGDQLAAVAAKEHLMQVDPSFQKNPKMDPITGAVIIVTVICMTFFGTAEVAANTKDPEVGKAIAGALSSLTELGRSALMLAKAEPHP